jgi:hypothetical protein
MCFIGCVAKSTENILEVWIKPQKKWARLSKTESKGQQENKILGERERENFLQDAGPRALQSRK